MTPRFAPRRPGGDAADDAGSPRPEDGARPGIWPAWADAEALAIRSAERWREPRDFDAAGPSGTLGTDGVAVVSFASNDYLGLSQHPSVVAAAHAALDRWGAGSGAARLVVGSRPVHSDLEAELAAWKQAERAVLFPTGYSANLGVIAALAGPGALICSDEMNHASLIDGARLARGEVAIYGHCDLEHLSSLLSERGDRRALVVSDAVFSMDGDAAPVEALAEVCARSGALLLLDEAHSVLGPEIPAVPYRSATRSGVERTDPIGPDTPVGLDGLELLRLGTLSKTLGSLGGFVAGPSRYTDLLVNRARPYIFTTAPTPADSAAALAALRVLRSAEGDGLVARLRAHVDRIAPGHPSPIIPVVCGDEARALDAAAALLERGMLVPAIRPPTVPVGTSRLRVTVSAAHSDSQVGALASALADLFPDLFPARTSDRPPDRPPTTRAAEMGQKRPPPAAETTHLDAPDRPRGRDGTQAPTPRGRNDPSRREAGR